jgi:hypothetical protein
MPQEADWRSAEAYTYLNDLDPAELAWEFLRRNSDYQRDYRATVRKAGDQAQFSDPVAGHWGLRFRDRSQSASR